MWEVEAESACEEIQGNDRYRQVCDSGTKQKTVLTETAHQERVKSRALQSQPTNTKSVQELAKLNDQDWHGRCVTQ